MKTPVIALLGVTLFASCQSGPTLSDSWSPQEIQGRFDVERQWEMYREPQGDFVNGFAESSLSRSTSQWLVTATVMKMSWKAAVRLLPGGFESGEPFQGGKLDSKALEAALKEMKAVGDALEIGTPRVLCYGGEESGVTIASQVAFMDGSEFKRGQNSLNIAPEIEIFHGGFMFSFVPSRSVIRNESQVGFEVNWSEVLNMTTHSPNSSNGLQIIPILSEQILRGEVNLAADESAFLPILYSWGDAQVLVVFLQVESAGKPQAEL